MHDIPASNGHWQGAYRIYAQYVVNSMTWYNSVVKRTENNLYTSLNAKLILTYTLNKYGINLKLAKYW